MEALAQLRTEIDRIDAEIVRLLAERMGVARKVAEVKREHGLPVRLPERIALVIERNAAAAEALGLQGDYLRRLYTEIIEETCREEEDLLGR
jgi:chorismate mutase-like protein